MLENWRERQRHHLLFLKLYTRCRSTSSARVSLANDLAEAQSAGNCSERFKVEKPKDKEQITAWSLLTWVAPCILLHQNIVESIWMCVQPIQWFVAPNPWKIRRFIESQLNISSLETLPWNTCAQTRSEILKENSFLKFHNKTDSRRLFQWEWQWILLFLLLRADYWQIYSIYTYIQYQFNRWLITWSFPIFFDS